MNWPWKTVEGEKVETRKTRKRQYDEFDRIEGGGYSGVIQAGISDNEVYIQNKLKTEGVDKIFEVIKPRDNQLLIDYDQSELPPRFEEAMDFLVRTFCAFGNRLTYKVTQSRHGNLHVIIDLPNDISELERLAWHGVFESDWKRNAASLMCMRRGVKNNTLLIERRDTPPLATGQRMFRRENRGDYNGNSTNDGSGSGSGNSLGAGIPAAS